MNASPLTAACSPVIEQLEPRQMLAVDLTGGVLTVTGSAGRDNIRVRTRGDQIVVNMGKKGPRSFDRDSVDTIIVNGRGGNDNIRASARAAFVTLMGGGGNDNIKGGGSGELILGGGGDDILRGAGGHDQLYGEAGDDVINGGKHNDTLGGDDEDQLTPDPDMVGNDTLNGGPGNDWLLSGQQSDEGLVDDPSGADALSGGPGDDVLDIRGRNAAGMQVGDGDGDTIDSEEPNDIVPTDDVAGVEQGEEDLTQHKHAFIKIFVNGQLIDIPDGAGEFNGQPVVHTHEAPTPLDVRGFLLHFHNTATSGGASRVFRLRDFFEHWGISFSSRNLGRMRVDDENVLELWVKPRGQGSFVQNNEFGQYAIQTEHNAGDTAYDQIEIYYGTPRP